MEEQVVIENFNSKCAGALLGTFVGDAVGAPIEDTTPEMIEDLLDEFDNLDSNDPRRETFIRTLGLLTGETLPPGSAYYTDDTQMMIGVAESLADCGDFDGADMAHRFVENFEEDRGYGAATASVLTALRVGAAWDEAANHLTETFENGSYGNGAAMRVAPIGVRFYNEPARLREVAELSAAITHTHPLGKEGAVLLAYAVAAALRRDPDKPFDTLGFLGELESTVRDESGIYSAKLQEIRDLLLSPVSHYEVAEILGTEATAPESVPAAIYSFLSHPYSLRDAVLYAIHLGGDTDTIGAMTGAIAGAYLGVEAIPEEWSEALENGAKGRDYVLELSENLAHSLL